MTTTTDLSAVTDALDLKDQLWLLLNEAFGPMHAAITLHGEVTRMQAEEAKDLPAIDAHLKSLGFLLSSLDRRLDDLKVLAE